MAGDNPTNAELEKFNIQLYSNIQYTFMQSYKFIQLKAEKTQGTPPAFLLTMENAQSWSATTVKKAVVKNADMTGGFEDEAS
jgi:hypothetical protein